MAILTLSLAGCATTLHSIPDDYQLGGGPASVVTGRVTLVMSIQPLEFFDHLDRISVEVKNDATTENYEIVCDKTGSDSEFFVTLPPGSYTLFKVDKGSMSALPHGRFTVPEAQVVYIGTLKFTDAGFLHSLAASADSGQSVVSGGWSVEDDYPTAVVTFSSRYPQIKQAVVRALAVVGR